MGHCTFIEPGIHLCCKSKINLEYGDLLPVNMVDLHHKLDELNAYLTMKRVVAIVFLFLFILGACGPKPYYKTAKGKKKQKYYNDIQFGGKSASEMKMK
jgi:hypothetical protein